MSVVLALLAVLLDAGLGEARRWHPLVGFGRLADALEQALNRGRWRRARGVLGVLALVLPFTVAVAGVQTWLRGAGEPFAAFAAALAAALAAGFIDVLALYFALGLRSLHEHAQPVIAALSAGDREAAQAHAARMVSRDSSALDPAAATTESVLENGNDGVFGALFWFLVAGAPGAIAFRLINTLDAMWGYRSARFHAYGWAAARLDDLVSWLPARLTALSYAVLGQTALALRCWRSQAPQWDSPNAGPVMAAGAGALGIELGGPARYQGEWHQRPALGAGPAVQGADIERALQLVRRAVALWLGLTLAWALLMAALRGA